MALLFVMSITVYLTTLMPEIGFSGDAAKFQFSSRVLGTPHTSGYPLYSLVSRLFSMLPLKNPAYRINFMSAFFAAAAVLVLFLIINKLTGNRIVSFISSLLFAFSWTFWEEAVIAEVYALNAFLIAIVIFSLMEWHETGKIKYLYLFFFFYSLSFAHHLTMILLLPAIIYFILITDYRTVLNPVNILMCLFSIIIGASLYLYIFIRTRAPASYVDMWAYNLKDFMWWIAGGQFKGRMFSFGLGQVFSERIPFYIDALRNQYLVYGGIAGLSGMCLLLRDKLKYALFFLLIFLGNLFFTLNYGIGDVYVFFIPTYLVFAIFIACALNAAFSCRVKFVKTGAAFLSMILVLALYARNLPLVDRSRDTIYGEFTDAVLEKIENNSVILAPNYAWGQFYLYKIIGEGKRRGDNILTHWYWHPYMVAESYPSYNPHPRIDGAEALSFKNSFSERDKTIICPYIFGERIPPAMNVYFHKGSKKKMDRAGFCSRELLHKNKCGYKLELFKLVKPGEETKKEPLPTKERVSPSPPLVSSFLKKGILKIDFTDRTRSFLLNGWSWTELAQDGSPFCWADDIESSFFVPLTGACDYALSFKASPLFASSCPGQTMEIRVNNKSAGKLMLGKDWTKYSVSIPSSFWKGGNNTVKFKYAWTASPSEVLGTDDDRDLAVSFNYIVLRKADEKRK